LIDDNKVNNPSIIPLKICIKHTREHVIEHDALAEICRMLDLIVFGATGFTGSLVAQYLVTKSCKLGIAGRSLPKLEELREKLLGIDKNANIELIRAESSDPESIDRMTAKTKVLITTVGPYLLYGEPVGKRF
jgi:short subunit dehydrogenase-like uncharacterized protein